MRLQNYRNGIYNAQTSLTWTSATCPPDIPTSKRPLMMMMCCQPENERHGVTNVLPVFQANTFARAGGWHQLLHHSFTAGRGREDSGLPFGRGTSHLVMRHRLIRKTRRERNPKRSAVDLQGRLNFAPVFIHVGFDRVASELLALRVREFVLVGGVRMLDHLRVGKPHMDTIAGPVQGEPDRRHPAATKVVIVFQHVDHFLHVIPKVRERLRAWATCTKFDQVAQIGANKFSLSCWNELLPPIFCERGGLQGTQHILERSDFASRDFFGKFLSGQLPVSPWACTSAAPNKSSSSSPAFSMANFFFLGAGCAAASMRASCPWRFTETRLRGACFNSGSLMSRPDGWNRTYVFRKWSKKENNNIIYWVSIHSML